MKKIFVALLFLLTTDISFTYAQTWQKVGNGMSHFVRGLFADTLENLLYAVGNFPYAGDSLVNQIAVWNGTVWDNIGVGTGDTNCYYGCDPVVVIKKFQDTLFVSGQNAIMNGIFGLENLAMWDGNNWIACGKQQGPVNLVITNNELFGLGTFDSINNKPIKRIAKWNGNCSWDTFGSSFGGYAVGCAAFLNNEYYFAGNFEEPNNIKEIMKWDGTQWQGLQNGILGDAWVNDIVAYKGYLFVAGLFYQSDGNPADFLIVWDGSNWIDPFPSVQYLGQVQDLEIINGELYIVGPYQISGDSSTYRLAKYNGELYCAFGGDGGSIGGTGSGNYPMVIAGLNDVIYVAVNKVFYGDTVNYIAQCTCGNQTDTCIFSPLSISETTIPANQISISPNPFTNFTTLTIPDFNQYNELNLKIYDILGREVRKQKIIHTTTVIHRNDLQQGIYFYKINSDLQWLSIEKFIID